MTYRLGVDLGTTFSAAAVERDGSIDVVTLGARAGAIPSALYLREDGELSFGEAAVLAGATDPLRFIGSVKRRIGDTEPVVLGGEPHEPIALLAALLRHVVGAAAEREGGPPEHVVVARPANWGPVKLAALEEVMAQAGLGARSSVTEPHAAAAFTFGQRVTAGQVVAVYDLGGGTFDAAVLGRTPTGFELLGRPEGVEHLGGLDFDEAVLFHVRRTLGDQWPRSTSGALSLELAMHRLRQECVAAKEALSFVEETAVPVVLPGVYTSVPITRAEFEDMIRPTLVESLGAFRRALAAAGVGPDDLTAVLLAGGSSQIPLVGELVREVAPNAATLGADAKYAVCRGAALLAEPGARSDPPPPPAHAQTAPVAVSAAALAAAGVAAGAGGAGGAGGAALPPPGEAPPPAPGAAAPEPAPPPDFVPAAGPAAGGPPRRRRGLLVGAALAAAAVLGAVGVAVSRGGGDGDDISQPSPITSAGPAARPVVASAAGMAAVPAGAYPLGVGGRSVQLEAFHLDRLQVSNAQYARFLQAVDGAALPADWDRRAAPGGQEDRPVVGVGWTWAKAYCTALGKDLPTEAEWEAAARGTAGRPLPWGDDLAAVALPPTGPYPVGSVAGNVTPEGVQDLVGNVWEWVREPYEPAPERQVVRRGGRSGLQLKGALDRQTVDQTNRSADAETGFRCAAARVDPAAEPDVFQTDVPHEAAPAAPAASASTGFDIDDSFEDPASGWPRRPSAEETAAGITVGYHGPSWYHLEMRQPGQREVLLRGVNYADAELTVTAYVLRQAQAGAFRYGLVFRAHPFDPANTADAAARQQNFYAFAINPSTQQWELLHTDTAPFRVVASGALPEGVAVSDEAKPDELGVELRGQALVMRINGGEVGQFQLSRQHPTGDVGFFLENLDAAGVHVHFDRITARAL